MNLRLSHAVVYVVDQARAKAFYTEKLGFEVRRDVRNGPVRYLTVGPVEQPDIELVLMPIESGPLLDDESARLLRMVVERGALGGGAFATDDCKKTFEALRGRGVEFLSEPTERPDGLEAVFRDDSGNYYSVRESRRRAR